MTQDVAASAAFNVVKEQVSHFVENSKVLLGLLDEVGKAHPIILGCLYSHLCFHCCLNAGAYCVASVSVFKGAIILGLNRQENDHKLITLNVTMCDMMQVMTLSVNPPFPSWHAHTPSSLKDVATSQDQGEDGKTIEQRLRDRMAGITDSIKECAKVYYTYKNRRTIGKCWFLWSSVEC